MSLMDEYHRRSDHGRDGAPMDSFTCNCRELFDEHKKSILAAIWEAVQLEVDDGWGNYMINIKRALQGKKSKRKKR